MCPEDLENFDATRALHETLDSTVQGREFGDDFHSWFFAQTSQRIDSSNCFFVVDIVTSSVDETDWTTSIFSNVWTFERLKGWSAIVSSRFRFLNATISVGDVKLFILETVRSAYNSTRLRWGALESTSANPLNTVDEFTSELVLDASLHWEPVLW
jgi:hypothetical protein